MRDFFGQPGAASPVFEPVEPRLLLAADVIISEFMALNDQFYLVDYLGRHSDWIEIHNAGDAAANLDGWRLRDDANEWIFPAMTLGAGEYRTIFASGDNLRNPAGELHTNFSLKREGEYLGLLRPDGTVAFEYAPKYPEQVKDISYGVGSPSTTSRTIVGEGTSLWYLVPTGGGLGLTWTATGFDHSLWGEGASSVGYETGGTEAGAWGVKINFQPAASVVPTGYLADGGLTFANRGNGYSYGWTFDVTADARERNRHADQRYDTLIHMQKAANAVWEMAVPNGVYDVFVVCGDPQYTSHINNLNVEGVVMNDPDGQDNFDTFVLQAAVSDGRLTVQPAPGASSMRICFIDIRGATEPSYQGYFETDLQAAMYTQAPGVYVRLPFALEAEAVVQTLALRVRYDDGFVAYLNGEEVARRNAPASPLYDSTATANHSDWEAIVFEPIDLASRIGLLRTGSNVLAVHALNGSAADPDFLLAAELVGDVRLPRPRLYYASPTPGSANVAGAAGLVADTRFSVDRGFFTAPFAVEITTATPGADIYYTLNGMVPDPVDTVNTVRYTGPVTLSSTTTLRAQAVRPGYIPSNVDTQTYVFLDSVIRQTRPSAYPALWTSTTNKTVTGDYDMDPDVVDNPLYSGTIRDDLQAVPTVSVVMDPLDLFGSGGRGIYLSQSIVERGCSIEMFYPEGHPQAREGFQIDAGIEIQGGTSDDRWKMYKLSMQVTFKDPWGPTKLEYPLFGDGGAGRFDTFILDARMNQSWAYGGGVTPDIQRLRAQYTRDQFVSDLQAAAGGQAPRGFHVHLYLNGMYWGLYWLHERPDESFASSYLGGDRDDYDVLKHTSSTIVNGTNANYNAMFAVADAGLASEAQYALLRQYLDVPDFINYMVVNYYAGNEDWAHHNWYASRNKVDPDGRWRYHSWDAEHVLKSVTYNATTTANSPWGSPKYLHHKLMQNSEYKQLFADHVHRLFFNGGILTPAGAKALYQVRLDEVDRAVVGESARWGDNQRAVPYTRDVEWVAERERLIGPFTGGDTGYFDRRTDLVLGQFRGLGLYPAADLGAPVFSQHGGETAPGFSLTMTKAAGAVGAIWYTLDGTDPRLPGGAKSAAAVQFTGPVALAARTNVMARLWNGTAWSALTEATFTPAGASPVRLTEVMYNPAPPSAAEIAAGYTDNGAFEYLELRNVTAQAVSLAGLTFTRGLDFTFPAVVLGPGESVVVARNPAAFLFRYPSVPAAEVLGPMRFQTRLDDAGERLVLTDTARGFFQPVAVQDFEYKDGWYKHTDGEGFSLVVRDPLQDLALWDSKDGWRASWLPGGSPGQDEPAEAVNPGAVVVNEVLAHTDAAGGDWIELHNTTGSPVPIGGWYLSDSHANLAAYRVPDGTVLPAYGYVVLTQAAHFGGAFALSEFGEAVCVSSSPAIGVLGGYREDQSFAASDREVTLGRYLKSTGGRDFVAMSAPTPGEANAYPRVGPVVISELLYAPAPGGDEFIELRNLTDTAVALYDPLRPANPWKFTAGVTFEFPGGTSIPAQGYALVVGIDPAVFRARYGIPAGVAIYGPYTGLLDNAGESVELSRPGDPEPGTGFVPYYRVDRVTYSPSAPWPEGPASGSGASLERESGAHYGNDVINWGAGPVGGTPGGVNTIVPPHVTAVRLNARDGRGPAGIDPSGAGVRTLDVTFSEAVTFAASDVLVQTVTLAGGVETVTATITPAGVTGSGTAVMTVTLPAGAAMDTWVKVTLAGNGTLRNAGLRRLDGEARAGGSGTGYVLAATDLPTGDGQQGGDTVFYVGSLRGDLNGDRVLTSADVDAFLVAYGAANLDADFRGVGFGAAGPDGQVTRGDMAGFVSVYQTGVAAGRGLGALPGTGGGAAGPEEETPSAVLAVSAAPRSVEAVQAAEGPAAAAPAAEAAGVAAMALPAAGEGDGLAAGAEEGPDVLALASGLAVAGASGSLATVLGAPADETALAWASVPWAPGGFTGLVVDAPATADVPVPAGVAGAPGPGAWDAAALLDDAGLADALAGPVLDIGLGV